MKTRPSITANILVGGIFSFTGAIFAALGILFFIFGDPSMVEGSFRDPRKNFLAFCGVFTFMGLLFFFVGLALLISDIRKNLGRKELIKNGYRIYAQITEVYEDNNIVINGHHPQYAVSRYEDPNTLTTQIFKSISFDTDLSGAIGMTVSVYLDPADHSKYYMDLDPESIVVKY